MIKQCMLLLMFSYSFMNAQNILTPLIQEVIRIHITREEKKRNLAMLRKELEKIKQVKEYVFNAMRKKIKIDLPLKANLTT